MKIENLISGTEIDLPEVAGHLNIKNSKFKVISIIPGGMGVCLKLRNLSNQISYCLKSVRPDFIGDKNIFNRFTDELEVWLSASECDGVTEALAIVRIDEIPTVLATWMEGGDLAHAMSILNSSQKVECIIRVVRTLNWVQKNLRVIHRDLKPSNILLDKDFKAYVSDWGLARPISNAILKITDNYDFDKFERPDRTHFGAKLGTALYMAPEQIRNSSKVDHRADIYSLGCIMYELETGSPPFSGTNAQEIFFKHEKVAPLSLNNISIKTNLGLEHIIERCLLKSPDDRYPTYLELESDLVSAARKRNFSLNNSDISVREKKYQLGKGHKALNQIIENAPVKGKGAVLLEFDKIAPFLQESSNLIELGRFSEAEKLLFGFFIPEIIKNPTSWHYGHSIALNYAFCLQHMDSRLDESLNIYESLMQAENKPAELFINYSLALLQSNRYLEAKAICQKGTAQYPDDIALLGNYTIALEGCNEMENAYKNAMRRLKLRRDVHSIEEAVSVLSSYRNQMRNSDLPQAMQIAQQQNDLIIEGLSINPYFASLRVAEIQLLIFINALDKALKASLNMDGDSQIPSKYKQLAFAEVVEGLSGSADYKIALDLIEKFKDVITFEPAQEKVQYIKWKIFADKYMIGKDTQDGERVVIKQVVDFFLLKENNEFIYPFMAARILEWLGDFQEAEIIILSLLEKSTENWEVIREYALMLIRANRSVEAFTKAKELIKIAPWRAESYDILSHTAEKNGDTKLSLEMKKKGDEVLKKEIALFDTLRNKIA